MAWTAPRTWVTNEIVTAAIMNTHVRDNLLETAAAKVTTAGDTVYATGGNALSRLAIGSATQMLMGGASAPSWSTLGDSGALVMDTAVESGVSALTTTGVLYLDVTGVTTGGPAMVSGHWMAEIERTDATTESGVQIQVRNDGVSLGARFSYQSGNSGIAHLIPSAGDIHMFTGSFFQEHASDDTSDYELFISADDNSRFQVNRGYLFVQSMIYPV